MLGDDDGRLLRHIPLPDQEPVTPLTTLTIDSSGRLTYMGQDGCRRVIIGDPDLLERLKQHEQITDEP